jgi:hypothetical protein
MRVTNRSRHLAPRKKRNDFMEGFGAGLSWGVQVSGKTQVVNAKPMWRWAVVVA